MSGNLEQVEWPYVAPSARDLEDMAKVNALLIQHVYADGKFTNSVYDQVRVPVWPCVQGPRMCARVWAGGVCGCVLAGV